MMPLQVDAALPDAAEGGSSSGPDGTSYPGTTGNFRTRAGGRQAASRPNNLMKRKFPVLHPVGKSTDRAAREGATAGGSTLLAKDVELSDTDSEKDVRGRHFLFDKKCSMLEGRRTVIPPLPRDYHVHRPGTLHPFSLTKELSHSQAERAFALGYPERYELNTSPAVLYPSTLVLNGRNTFSVDHCKLSSRPKVTYPTYNLATVKDNQKSQSYPDPMPGASRSFIHRTTELSSLEGETVRQEKLKKMRKLRKPPS